MSTTKKRAKKPCKTSLVYHATPRVGLAIPTLQAFEALAERVTNLEDSRPSVEMRPMRIHTASVSDELLQVADTLERARSALNPVTCINPTEARRQAEDLRRDAIRLLEDVVTRLVDDGTADIRRALTASNSRNWVRLYSAKVPGVSEVKS